MQNNLIKFVQNAVNFVATTTEQLQKTVNQLVADRRISLEEGKKMYEDFVKNTEVRREEFEQQLTKIFDKLTQNLNIARLSELEELKERIAVLEEKVKALENSKQSN